MSDCGVENVSKRFWDRWYEADELERVDIVKELEVDKSTISPHAVATLINSFFADLVEYLESQKGIQRPKVRHLKEEVREDMKLLTIKNLLTYWRMFGSSEVPIPKGAETLVKDTIQALEEYKEVLETKDGNHKT